MKFNYLTSKEDVPSFLLKISYRINVHCATVHFNGKNPSTVFVFVHELVLISFDSQTLMFNRNSSFTNCFDQALLTSDL